MILNRLLSQTDTSKKKLVCTIHVYSIYCLILLMLDLKNACKQKVCNYILFKFLDQGEGHNCMFSTKSILGPLPISCSDYIKRLPADKECAMTFDLI